MYYNNDITNIGENLMAEKKKEEIKIEEIPEKENKVTDTKVDRSLDPEQIEFQNKVKRDVEKESDIIDEYVEDSNELVNEKENEIDDLDIQTPANN